VATSRRKILKGIAAAGLSALASAESNSSSQSQHEETEFDYVVVGAGPGGGPLACNLAKAGYTVCLIEAGPAAKETDLQQLMKVPAFNGKASSDPRIAWEYFVRHYSDEQQQVRDSKYVAKEKGILYPRASTIGGCGIHNALIMLYPSDSDWEHIVDITGDKSWSPDRMRGYFQRLEQCRYTDPSPFSENVARHGFHGWQAIEMPDPQLFYGEPQIRRIQESAESVVGNPGDLKLYLEDKLDPNDYVTTKINKEGLYAIPTCTKHGERWSVRDLVLETAAAYPTLTLMTNCLVTRVLMNGDNSATGVECMQGEHLYRASPLAGGNTAQSRRVFKAKREVIISAGTFNSPQILKLSGIGPGDELAGHGIRTQIALPGVGTGMMDRYEISVVTQLKNPLTLRANCVSGSPTDPCLLNWERGKGIYTTVIPFGALRKADPTREDRDILIALAPTPFQGYFPGWPDTLNNPTQFSWLVLKAHTQNRAGTVKLRSGDPRDTPIIDFHYFQEGTDQTGEDLESVVDAVEIIRQMNAQIKDLAIAEVVPGLNVVTREDIATFVKDEAWGHHASCSNRMGPSSDPMSVVDSNFKVIGTRNLRVVDASVFPRIPGYFPMVAILMMSEKASDVILAEARAK
jgi:choline dehydrogenase